MQSFIGSRSAACLSGTGRPGLGRRLCCCTAHSRTAGAGFASWTTLSDEFTVIAVDAPGFGASDDPPPTWTTADYGNHLGDILDALGLIRPTVVGLSFGSVYALALYRQRPQTVGALILVSAYA